MNGRRFLLRGLGNVRAEFTLLATVFSLRMLWKQWATGRRFAPVFARLGRPMSPIVGAPHLPGEVVEATALLF